MNKIITFLFLIICVAFNSNNLFAQKKQVLGKIISKTRDLEGIHIKNKTSNNSVLSQKGGYFSIDAQPNDTLVLSAVHLVGREKVLTYADLNKTMLFIPMELLDNILTEIVIDKRISTESLGLGGARKLTPAERRLHTATSSGGGIIAIDAIVNAISGRTKMLEKALAMEKEYQFVEEVLNRFPDEFYSNNLNIPLKYKMAFGYFMIQDPLIITSYKNVDITQLSLMYTEKALEFLEIVKVLK